MFCNTYVLREVPETTIEFHLTFLHLQWPSITTTIISCVSSLSTFGLCHEVALLSMSLRVADMAFNCPRLSERQLVRFRGQNLDVGQSSIAWGGEALVGSIEPLRLARCAATAAEARRHLFRHDCESMPMEPLAGCSSCTPGRGSCSHWYCERSICHIMRMLTGTCQSRFAFAFSSSPPCVNP